MIEDKGTIRLVGVDMQPIGLLDIKHWDANVDAASILAECDIICRLVLSDCETALR